MKSKAGSKKDSPSKTVIGEEDSEAMSSPEKSSPAKAPNDDEELEPGEVPHVTSRFEEFQGEDANDDDYDPNTEQPSSDLEEELEPGEVPKKKSKSVSTSPVKIALTAKSNIKEENIEVEEQTFDDIEQDQDEENQSPMVEINMSEKRTFDQIEEELEEMEGQSPTPKKIKLEQPMITGPKKVMRVLLKKVPTTESPTTHTSSRPGRASKTSANNFLKKVTSSSMKTERIQEDSDEDYNSTPASTTPKKKGFRKVLPKAKLKAKAKLKTKIKRKSGISRKWEKKWENSDALADLIEDCGISTDATPVLKGSNKKVKMKNFGVQCRMKSDETEHLRQRVKELKKEKQVEKARLSQERAKLRKRDSEDNIKRIVRDWLRKRYNDKQTKFLMSKPEREALLADDEELEPGEQRSSATILAARAAKDALAKARASLNNSTAASMNLNSKNPNASNELEPGEVRSKVVINNDDELEPGEVRR